MSVLEDEITVLKRAVRELVNDMLDTDEALAHKVTVEQVVDSYVDHPIIKRVMEEGGGDE